MRVTSIVHTLCCLLLAASVFSSCSPAASTSYSNPLQVQLGDPFVLKGDDGLFYMYGTSEGVNGFKTYSSKDLVSWTDRGVVYQGGGASSWAKDCFWAPEVYHHNGKYYMFFSANWKHNPTNEGENFRIGVAVADKPTGPFTELNGGPIFDPGYPIIDANILFDKSGRIYLYYSRCCYKNPVESEIASWAKNAGIYSSIEESWVYGVEINPTFSGIIGQPSLLLTPPKSLSDVQSEWESRSVTSKEVNRRWTEGSTIFEHNGLYYIMYSANFFGGENYAVGYATSSSPLGPFVKSKSNPVLQKNTSKGGVVTGTGHNSILKLDSGAMLCIYHGRTSKTGSNRVVFIDKMRIDKEGLLIVDGPTTTPQAMPLSK